MRLRSFWLGGATLLALSTPALADDATVLKRLDDMQRAMELQQKQIAAQRAEINALRGALRHIMAHKDALWLTTPGEIARYCETLPKGIVPGS